MTTENESRSITPTIPAQTTDTKVDQVSLLSYQIVIETLRIRSNTSSFTLVLIAYC
jgi:hypothetical protein